MHIICETMPEFNKLKKVASQLSDGDTAYVQSVQRTYSIQNGEFVLSIDFKEHQREFRSKKEEEEFTSTLTRESVVDFLAEHAGGDYSCPWRYIQACRHFFQSNFKYFYPSSGYCQPGLVGDKVKNDWPYDNFSVKLERNQPINDEVIGEFVLIWNAQRWVHPHIDQLSFDIFEHTLSIGGSYGLKVNVYEAGTPGECAITHSYRQDMTFKSVKAALEYIAKNHWYGDEEGEDFWDDDADGGY